MRKGKAQSLADTRITGLQPASSISPTHLANVFFSFSNQFHGAPAVVCCWEEMPPTSHPQAPDASLGRGSSHKCSHRTSHPCMLAGFGAKADIQRCTLVFQNIQLTSEEINAKTKLPSRGSPLLKYSQPGFSCSALRRFSNQGAGRHSSVAAQHLLGVHTLASVQK